MRNPVTLLLTVLMLSSCTTMIFINKPLPSEIEVQEKDQKIVIQNFFDYTRAAHNLYVAYTALGDEAMANSWLERAK